MAGTSAGEINVPLTAWFASLYASLTYNLSDCFAMLPSHASIVPADASDCAWFVRGSSVSEVPPA